MWRWFVGQVFLTSALAGGSTVPTALMVGHYEIHVDYSPVAGNPDAGWRFSVSYDSDSDFSTSAGVVRLDPATTTIVASPKSIAAVPSPAGVFSRFGPSGTPLWVLPQNQILGVPFLGFRTTMATGLFQARVGNNYTPNGQGSISLKLISVEGSGPARGGKFATWKSESFGTTVFSFDSTDGISSADEIPTIPVSSHTHYNWALTRPGVYRVTIEAQGRLMPAHGNGMTSARGTFLFSVPFSSSIAQGAVIAPCVTSSNELGMVVADSSLNVAYAPENALIEMPPSPTSGWQAPLVLTRAARTFSDAVGVSLQDASASFPPPGWTDTAWEITDIQGAGQLVFLENGAELPRRIELTPATLRNLTVRADQSGLYRVTGFVSGMHSGVVQRSTPVTLVFGAGTTANFNYPTWRDSFERSRNLPNGSLLDPSADFDRDGLSNSTEFVLFWQGLDPTSPDAHRMPQAGQTPEGYGQISFLRDTYKDPLDDSSWRIEPSTSADLSRWTTRNSRVPGFPLEIFETAAGPGNALGRIMKRQLRVIQPAQSRTFFRFQISPPKL